ncbi:MAG: two-component regulator propeller domain-containing protein [Bacteroidia bacterium]
MTQKPALFVFTFLFSLVLNSSPGQNLAIGEWRVHLPFIKARSVADGGNKIYCAAEDGLFFLNKDDNSLTTYSKINGLSDIGINVIGYDPDYDVLFVGYENANIDLVFNNQVVNIPDIKRKNIVGAKSINGVSFVGKFAYLACGFGIVVVDLEKQEIKDTYYIGPNGENINVFGIAFDGTNLFATTDSGVYTIDASNPNITFYGAWINVLIDNSNSEYDQIVFFNNKIYVKVNEANNNDYVLRYDTPSWTNTGISIYEIRKLQATNSNLVIAATFNVKVYDTMQQIKNIDQTTYDCFIHDATFDNSGTTWIADNHKGLVKIDLSSQIEYIAPDGPYSKLSADLQIVNNQLWLGHCTRGGKWDNLFTGDGFSTFTFVDNNWATYNRTNLTSNIVSLDSLFDFMAVAIDPRKASHVFLGSRGAGLLEMEDGVIKNYYNEFNSTLQTAVGNPGSCQTGGIAFDKDYNLWVVNSTVAAPLSVLKTDGTWQSYSFPGGLAFNAFLGEFLIDSYNQKWIDNNQSGVLVFDESGTLGTQKYRFLNSDEGNGHLPSNDIRAMVEDKEGQVWFGTAKGVAVFYSPSSVLNDNVNSDAQQILLLQDGTYQYLLETEIVTAIAVDGANFKWFGTENSGVYLMSPDGTKQIVHFTAENSPLLSNNIASISINQKTGEVFFATDRGIISMKGIATEGGEQCDSIYVYPNPVYNDYEGIIAIKGVMNNGNIKITDISGTLVYETTALGGQGIWDGKNFNGEKAHTGVYLVFCSDTDGKNTCISKLLLFN